MGMYARVYVLTVNSGKHVNVNSCVYAYAQSIMLLNLCEQEHV